MGGRRGKYPTIKDVARLANTSTATVSYVLSGNTDRLISLELRDRVLDAAEELHYTKSAVASSLRVNRRGLVFLLIPQFSNIYFTRACESLEDVIIANDFLPMICDTREDPERERKLIENAVAQRADGIILGPTSSGWKNTAILRKLNIPYVVVGRGISPDKDSQEENDAYFVGDDSYQAGFLAGRCFARNGHRRIGVIEWNGAVSSAMDRSMGFYEGIRRQLQNGGSLEVESSDVLSTEEGYRLTRELLQRTRPTALFFGYHSYAQGGVRYLAEMGLSVPEDISVIMVGTPDWAQFSSPKYHTIYQSENWVGSTAGRILMAQLQGEESPLLAKKRYICPCQLIEGNSVKDLTRL